MLSENCVLSAPAKVHPGCARLRGERLCVIRPEALHERSLADLNVAENLLSIFAQDLKASVHVPGVGHVAQMVRDSVVEKGDERAESHARKNPIHCALDRIRRLSRIDACESA